MSRFETLKTFIRSLFIYYFLRIYFLANSIVYLWCPLEWADETKMYKYTKVYCKYTSGIAMGYNAVSDKNLDRSKTRWSISKLYWTMKYNFQEQQFIKFLVLKTNLARVN